ncbi:MAG: hypothetical protein WCD77_20410, partial [Acidobacteriaceae bacterium]
MATFRFYRKTPPSSTVGTVLQLDKDVVVGDKSFEKAFGSITTLELDLLTIASAIFASDQISKFGVA